MKKTKATKQPRVATKVMARHEQKATPVDRSDFAKFVIAYRQIHGLSQQELADKIKLAKTGVALAEMDKFELPVGFFRKLYPILSEGEKTAVVKMFTKKITEQLNNPDGGK